MWLHTVQTLIDGDLGPRWDFQRTSSVVRFAPEMVSVPKCFPGLHVEQCLSAVRPEMELQNP